MNSAARITSQLELMAGEAAHLYADLCFLEGESPLLDPHNVAVLEKLLDRQASAYRTIWGREEG